MKNYTYKEILDLLDLTATATHQHNEKGKPVQIIGNKELEELRAKDVKVLEDMLFESFANSDMFKGGIKYIRKYEHMYKHLI
jgi:hypothetical protein